MQQPFDKVYLGWLIVVLLSISNPILASVNDLTIDNDTDPNTGWNANCSFEEVSMLMKGPDEDLLRFSVQAIKIAGVSPGCDDLNTARIKFTYDGVVRTVTAGTPLDIILSGSDELGSSINVSSLEGSFRCSNSSVADLFGSSCLALNAVGGGTTLVFAGSKASHTFSTNGGCGTSASVNFKDCPAVELRFTVTYEKKRLKINLAENEESFVCAPEPPDPDNTGPIAVPSVRLDVSGDLNASLGNTLAYEVADSPTGIYTLINESRSKSFSANYSNLGNKPGFRYLRVRDLSCSGRTSPPITLTAYPRVNVNATFSDVSCAADEFNIEIARDAFFDTVDLQYSIARYPFENTSVLPIATYVYESSGDATVRMNNTNRDDRITTSDIRTNVDASVTDQTGIFLPGFTYIIRVDLKDPSTGSFADSSGEGTGLCPASFTRDYALPAALSIEMMPSGGADFCDGTSASIAGSFSNAVGNVELVNVRDGGSILSGVGSASSIAADKDYNLHIDGNNFTFTSKETGDFSFVFKDDCEVNTDAKDGIETSIMLTRADPLVVTINNEDIDCPGDTDGSITVTITGGFGMNTVNIGDQVIALADGAYTRENLSPGDYTVSVTNDESCNISYVNDADGNSENEISIERPLPFAPANTLDAINVCDGTARVTLTPLEAGWTWSPVAPNTATLVSGTTNQYNVTQISGTTTYTWEAAATGCSNDDKKVFQSITITDFDINANAGNEQYRRENSASLSGNGLSGDETGTWTFLSGSGSFSNSGSNTTDVTDLAVGENQLNWNVSLRSTVETENATEACRTADSQVLIYYSNLSFDAMNTSVIPERCPDDGEIAVAATGGNPNNPTYFINGDNFRYKFTLRLASDENTILETLYAKNEGEAVTFTGRSDGNYVVRLEDRDPYDDGRLTPVKSTFEIINRPALEFDITTDDITPSFCNSGIIVLKATGGKGPYAFEIKDQGSADSEYRSVVGSADNLSAGNYTIRLTDANLSACNTITQNFNVPSTLIDYIFSPSFSGQVSDGSSGGETIYYVCDNSGSISLSFELSFENNNTPEESLRVSIFNRNNLSSAIESMTYDGGQTVENFRSLSPGQYRIITAFVSDCSSRTVDFSVASVKPSVTSFSEVLRSNNFSASCFNEPDGAINVDLENNSIGNYAVNLIGSDGSRRTNNSGTLINSNATIRYSFSSLPVKNADGVIQYSLEVSRTFGTQSCTYSNVALGGNTVSLSEPDEIFIQNALGGSPVTSYDIDCPGEGIELVYRADGGTGTYQAARLINNRTMAERTANSVSGVFTFTNVMEDNTTYNLIITDSDGCEKTLENIMVNDPDDLTVTEITTEPPTCFGGDDGTFRITVEGGTPDTDGYKFQITDARMVNSLSSDDDSDFDGPLNNVFGITDEDPNKFTAYGEFTRPAGIYTVQVLDEKSCTVTDPIEVTVENADRFLVDMVIPTPASCSETEDGSLQITTIGGNSGTYKFDLFEVATGSNLPVFKERKTSTDGTVSFSMLSGDVNKFTYLVNVLDGEDCPASMPDMSPGIIANPVEVVQIGMSSPPLCNIVNGDDASGSFVVEGRGGRGSFSFSLTGEEGSFESESGNRFEFKNRKPGSYSVYVKDGSNCIAKIAENIIVEAADPIDIETIVNLDATRDQTMSATLSYALCDGETTSITVGESNGKYPMTYQLTGTTETGAVFSTSILSASVANEQETFNDIPAGTYQVTAIHDGQCTAVSNNIRLFTTERPVVSVDKSIKVSQAGTDYHVSCNGGADGVLSITVDQRTYFCDFTIELFADGISTGNGITVAGGTALEFTGLSASSASTPIVYTYTVKNALIPQCTWEYNDPIILNEPDQLNITNDGITTPLFNGFEIACFGDAIEYQVDFEGGIYPFRIFLKNDLNQTIDATLINETGAKSHVFSNVSEGNYYIEIEDFFGNTCEVRTPDFNIDAPPLLEPSVANNLPPTCLAGSDGTIQLSATGGNPISGTSYKYEITNYTLSPPFNVAGQNCNPFSTAMIEGAGATFRLPAGRYDFQITDENECVKTLQNIVVELPTDPLIIDAVIAEEPSCNGAKDGKLKVLAKDGNPLSGGRYEYRLSGGDLLTDEIITTADTAVFEGLFSSEDVGTYTISVFDTDACCLVADYNYRSNIEITQPRAMELSLVGEETNQPICFEGTDGSRLTVEVTGGVGPYTFSTDGMNFSTSPLGSRFQLTEIPGGEDYIIYVRDSRFSVTQAVCTISDAFFLPDGPVLSIETSESEVSCFGGNDGSATAVVALTGSEDDLDANSTDNESAFTYEWFWLEENRIVATTKDADNLSAGTYRLKVQRNGLVCEQTAIAIIKQPQKPLGINDLEAFDLSCGGRSDGSVIISITGGNPLANQKLKYSLNGSGLKVLPITNTIRDLSEGTYDITIQNASGCSASGKFEILSNQLQVTANVDQEISCFGFADGRLSVETSMALEAFVLPTNLEYSLDGINYQSSPLFDGLSAGSYQVTVRDAANNFCTGISEEIELGEPIEITINNSLIAPSNCGQADGAVNVTTNAINPVITWLDMTNSVADPMGLSAGTYRILVVDESGCSAETTYTMEDAPDMILTPVLDARTYCDLPRGRAHVEISNGKAPYLVSWNNGTQVLTGQSVEGLTGGIYQISVTDANGCNSTSSLEIVNQAPFTVELTESVSTACGEDLGSLTVTASDGFAPYNYYWPALDVNGQTVDGLSQGNYQVIVTDNLGCTVSETFTIFPESGNISVETSLTLPVCNSNTGSITIDNVIGGVAPYQFTWRDSNQQLLQEDGRELTNLTVGTYFIEVLDNDGCRYAQPAIELVSDVSLEPTLTLSTLESSFCEAANGSVTIGIIQGQAPYQINVFDEAAQPIATKTTSLSTLTFDQLRMGTYEAILTDAYGCESSLDFTITDRPLPQISISDVGSATREIAVGKFTVDISNPVGDAFTYLVDDQNGNVRSFEVPEITGLLSGSYLVSATNGTCTTNTVLVSIGENEPIEVSASIADATCSISSDGAVLIAVQGGIEPYTTEWQDIDGNEIEADLATAQNLPVGHYMVLIRDAIGTTLEYPFEINALPQLSIEIIEQQNPNCFEACDGLIEVLVSGGSGNYSVDWNNGMEGSRISGLCSGTYQVTISDEQNGVCSTTKSITLEEPNEITAELSESRLPTCFNGNDGSLTVEVSGGSGLFELIWDNGTQGKSINGISVGTYSVTVNDLIGGCQHTFDFELADQLPIELAETMISPPSCNGASDGSVNISLINTTNPLINWSNGDVGFTAAGLTAGEHTFTVLDENGCRFAGSVTIPETPALIVTSMASSPVSCFENTDGTISIEVSGGTGEKSVSWFLAGNEIAEMADDFSPSLLAAGNYEYIVEDENGCSISGDVEVTSPDPLVFTSISATPVSCNDGDDGQIALEVNGGNGIYTFTLDGAATDFPAAGLIAGDYLVGVSDQNGCAISQTVSVVEPSILLVDDVEITDVSCDGAADGAIIVSVFGGNGEYAFEWSNGQQTSAQSESTIDGLTTGDYEVTITDGKGCQIMESYAVGTPNPIGLVNLSIQNPQCFQGTDGQISFDIIGGTAPYTYSWDHDNEADNAITNLSAGSYSVTVTDSNGCFRNFDFTLEDPLQLFITTLDETQISLCNGSSIPLDAGDWASYHWYLNDELISSDQVVEADSRGIYRVVVQSEKGCFAEKSVEVQIEENPLTADFVFDTDIFARDTLVVIDVSWPVPGEISWFFPEGVTRLTGDDDAIIQELIFDEPGIYTIGMMATDQGCNDYIEKHFEVLEKNERSGELADRSSQIRETAIEETVVSPVPNNGQFELIVKLDQRADVEVSIYGFSNRGLLKTLEGKSQYTYQFDINLGDVTPGVYLVVTRSGKSTKVNKIIVR
ncbi:MAG: hypothetical protein AAFQ94_11930 [Bacteroidota bacterium]